MPLCILTPLCACVRAFSAALLTTTPHPNKVRGRTCSNLKIGSGDQGPWGMLAEGPGFPQP